MSDGLADVVGDAARVTTEDDDQLGHVGALENGAQAGVAGRHGHEGGGDAVGLVLGHDGDVGALGITGGEDLVQDAGAPEHEAAHRVGTDGGRVAVVDELGHHGLAGARLVGDAGRPHGEVGQDAGGGGHDHRRPRRSRNSHQAARAQP